MSIEIQQSTIRQLIYPNATIMMSIVDFTMSNLPSACTRARGHVHVPPTTIADPSYMHRAIVVVGRSRQGYPTSCSEAVI